MTSTSTIQIPQHSEGRTVRDVVEYQHELVTEVWCRKIFRQVLQSLEAQYAAQMPHRAITPDTIVFQENGEPMLLPSPYVTTDPGLAADLRALAAVIHYAITLELAPEAPLRGRQLDGFSASLLGAVDRCLSPDPQQRPRSIDELRNLLGIVAVGSSVPAVPRVASKNVHPDPVAPIPAAVAVPVAPSAPRGAAPAGRWKRPLLIGVAALVLLTGGMALLALLRATTSGDPIVLSQPPAARTPHELDTNGQPPPPAPAMAAQEAAPPGLPAPAAGAANAPAAGAEADDLAMAPPAEPRRAAPERASGAAPAREASAAAALVTYKLQVKPWGTVYVDGEERGVSPPLKRLALAPGQHTVRLVNPSFPDHVIRIDAGRYRTGMIAHDFSAR